MKKNYGTFGGGCGGVLSDSVTCLLEKAKTKTVRRREMKP